MNSAALTIYGFGHFGKSLLWMSSVLIFAFFLTEVAELHPTTMGWVMAVSLLINAGSDWLIGRSLTRYIASVRAASRVQLAGSALAALSFTLFAQTATIAPDQRTAYALATLIAFRLGYSLYDVPQNAMLGLVTGNDSDRSQIAAVRYAAAGMANILVTLCLSIWLVQVNDDSREAAFSLVASGFAGIAFVSAVLVAVGFAGAYPPPRESVPGTSSQAAMPIRSAEQLPPILAFGSILIFSSLMPVFSKLKVYFAAFAFAQDGGSISFLLCAALGQVLAQPIWARIGRLHALISLYRCAALAVIAVGVIFGLASTATPFWLLLAAFLFGAASSGLLMAIWSIMGNVAAAQPDTALAQFGRFTFCSKLAQAGSMVLVGQVLAADAYRDGLMMVIIIAMTSAVVLTGCLCLAIGNHVLERRSGSRPLPWPGQP